MAAIFDETLGGDFEAQIKQFSERFQNAVARVGAQSMAQLVYQSARINVPKSGLTPHYFYGSAAKKAAPGEKTKYRYEFNSGDLRAAIYQAFSARSSNETRKEYHVGWNHGKGTSSKPVPYGFMVEFGTARAPAHPFLYPAFAQNRGALLHVACEAMREEIMSGVR